MIRAELVAVVVDTSPLFVTGGSVNDWTRGVTDELYRACFVATPIGKTGDLASSVRSRMTAIPFLRTISVSASASTDHVMYVHKGTANNGLGHIYTTEGYVIRREIDNWIDSNGPRPINPLYGNLRGYLMPVPGTRGRARVHGQKANPFLIHGYNKVAERHRALRHMDVPTPG